MFRGVRLRMAASHAGVLAVILVALGASGYLLLSRSLDRSATQELRAAAEGQVARIVEHEGPLPAPDSDVPSAAAIKVVVFAPNGTIVGDTLEVPPWLSPGRSEVSDATVSGERVRVVTLKADVHGVPIATVVAGRSLKAEDALLHRVRLLLLAGGAVAVAVSLGAGWWLAGRAVRPIQRAYDAQAAFAADASHELRTPLTFIRSGVEFLAEGEPDLGSQVLGEIDYMTDLTQRMLLLARAEHGRVVLERKPFDVAEVCRSAARRSEIAHHSRLQLSGPGRLEARGDRVAAAAVLDAVLENVGLHGGGVATVHWEPSGNEVMLTVADHGPGLPSELAPRAFERFARADPSRARDTGGAGLGLALARSLTEAQGGRMWLEPTPGGGLSARMAFPAATRGTS